MRVEGGEHREDDLSVLHCPNVPGGEGAAVTIAVHVEDHGQIDATGTKEVPVERMWQPIGGDGRARRRQGLRRDLAAVEGVPLACARFVLTSEQITIEPLEIEQLRERRRRHVTSPLTATEATAVEVTNVE